MIASREHGLLEPPIRFPIQKQSIHLHCIPQHHHPIQQRTLVLFPAQMFRFDAAQRTSRLPFRLQAVGCGLPEPLPHLKLILICLLNIQIAK